MFERKLNRVVPEIGAELMRTHAISAPVATHWRRASCEDIGCLPYRNGWTLSTAGLDDQMIHTAKNSGRSFTVTRDADGAEVLVFEPGQPCFKTSTHRQRLDREEVFLARDGDWRGNPRRTDSMIFSGPDAWADSLHTATDQFGG